MDSALASEFLANFLADNASALVAGSPSFEIGGDRGDARRSRKGLTPADVERLIQANPSFADQIRQMYMPGPSLPRLPGA